MSLKETCQELQVATENYQKLSAWIATYESNAKDSKVGVTVRWEFGAAVDGYTTTRYAFEDLIDQQFPELLQQALQAAKDRLQLAKEAMRSALGGTDDEAVEKACAYVFAMKKQEHVKESIMTQAAFTQAVKEVIETLKT